MKFKLYEEQSPNERRLNYYLKRTLKNEFKNATGRNLVEVHHLPGSDLNDIDLSELVLIPDDNDLYRIHNFIHNSVNDLAINLSDEDKNKMNNKYVYLVDCNFIPIRIKDFISNWKALEDGM